MPFYINFPPQFLTKIPHSSEEMKFSHKFILSKQSQLEQYLDHVTAIDDVDLDDLMDLSLSDDDIAELVVTLDEPLECFLDTLIYHRAEILETLQTHDCMCVLWFVVEWINFFFFFFFLI